MRLSDLERVAPALLPHRSATVRPIDWELLQTTLGVALPTDYREFVDHYPPLHLDDVMILRVPEPGDEAAYVSGVFSLSEEFASLSEDGLTEDYTFHPAEGGLICWGGTDTGDYFFWRKDGPDPDRWPAVVSSSTSYWWEHDGGFLALIVGLIDGTVEHWGLPPQPGPNPTVGLALPAPPTQD
ncbi:SMI1/KNR4 family protein [Plantactinospora soyae]|uniref:SMI1/KNR4 family protein n=1 Tax=Plantactinospora soyae TaxID=1544732 RepID=A0A927M5G1_9ACTN|nr:hypothetical protein [Plantactinospora soyae]MBE1488334.1 hypothetical protein [Plantactinospora soyae]